MIRGSDGKLRYPLAAEWADKGTKIPNWRILRPEEMPQRGDVGAYKLPGGGAAYSGHTGIITSVDGSGGVRGIAAHHDIVGPDRGFDPRINRSIDIVYRRYTGGK
jgi:hypothetical protein